MKTRFGTPRMRSGRVRRQQLDEHDPGDQEHERDLDVEADQDLEARVAGRRPDRGPVGEVQDQRVRDLVDPVHSPERQPGEHRAPVAALDLVGVDVLRPPAAGRPSPSGSCRSGAACSSACCVKSVTATAAMRAAASCGGLLAAGQRARAEVVEQFGQPALDVGSVRSIRTLSGAARALSLSTHRRAPARCLQLDHAARDVAVPFEAVGRLLRSSPSPLRASG